MAKQSKKLTRDQKELLDRNGYNAADCRYLEEDREAYRFLDTSTGFEFWVSKEMPKKRIVWKDDNGTDFSGNRNEGIYT